jgi:hypothetical protein
MKLKTSELQGAVLDWAVAKCEGKTKLYQIRRGDSRVIDTDGPEYFEQYKPARRVNRLGFSWPDH